MKILLIGNYERDYQFSMQKFSACLEQELVRQGHQVRVLLPPAVFGRGFDLTISGLAKWLGYIDKHLLFPFTLIWASRWADIIHICDHSNAVYVPYLKHRKHLVTCHDMMAVRSALGEFEEYNQVGKAGKLLQEWILGGLRAAGHIATVSTATKQDVIRLAAQPAEQVTVILNGLNYAFNPLAKDQALALLTQYGISENQRFLLHVGGDQWYKNRKGVLSIFAELLKLQPDTDLKLVMAGQAFGADMQDCIRQHQLQDKVIAIVRPSTEALAALYSLATAFVFPSLCEGFGWPIIEAQACNALVFTSNFEPMTEVGGEAAVYIDPKAPDQAAATIIATLGDDERLKNTIKANQANLLRFGTELMVERYAALYERILAN